tara:strand:+ start:168 stop:503 length:336 start_codon:yes stop_codon:yes gene_type:complete
MSKEKISRPWATEPRAKNRLTLKQAQDQELKNGTSWTRIIEMKLEGKGNIGIMIQFFRDWEIYGLREALLLLKNYEDRGEIERGTFDELSKVAQLIFDGTSKEAGMKKLEL